jgi:hypothetical protein
MDMYKSGSDSEMLVAFDIILLHTISLYYSGGRRKKSCEAENH